MSDSKIHEVVISMAARRIKPVPVDEAQGLRAKGANHRGLCPPLGGDRVEPGAIHHQGIETDDALKGPCGPSRAPRKSKGCRAGPAAVRSPLFKAVASSTSLRSVSSRISISASDFVLPCFTNCFAWVLGALDRPGAAGGSSRGDFALNLVDLQLGDGTVPGSLTKLGADDGKGHGDDQHAGDHRDAGHQFRCPVLHIDVTIADGGHGHCCPPHASKDGVNVQIVHGLHLPLGGPCVRRLCLEGAVAQRVGARRHVRAHVRAAGSRS